MYVKGLLFNLYILDDIIIILCSLRQQLNELGQGEYKLTVNDFLIKACAAAMSKVPKVNSSWADDHIRQYNQVDISMAVSTDKGLITPIIFGADTKVHVTTLPIIGPSSIFEGCIQGYTFTLCILISRYYIVAKCFGALNAIQSAVIITLD